MFDPMEQQALKEEYSHLQGLVVGLNRIRSRMVPRSLYDSGELFSGPTEVKEMFQEFQWDFGQTTHEAPTKVSQPEPQLPIEKPKQSQPSPTDGFFEAFGWNDVEPEPSDEKESESEPPRSEAEEDTSAPPTTDQMFNDFDWR